MSKPNAQSTDPISRFDLFCFRRPLYIEGKEVNLFFKSDVRSTFAQTLDGDLAHANKTIMQRAIKLPSTEIKSLSQVSQLFEAEFIEAFDLRSSEYPHAIVVVGGELPHKHSCYSQDPSLAIELKGFVASHNEAVARMDKKPDVVIAPAPTLNVANCF